MENFANPSNPANAPVGTLSGNGLIAEPIPGQTTAAQQATAQSQGFQPINTAPGVAISADSLMGAQTQTPVTVPQSTTPPATQPTATPPPGTTANENGTVTAITPTPSTNQQIQNAMAGLIQEEGTEPQVESQLNSEANISGLTTGAATAYNNYQQAKLALQQQVATIQQNTSGMSASGVQQMVDQANRVGNANLANLSVISDMAQNNLTAAQKTVTDKITAQFQPITDQINFLKDFASVNNADLTDSQKAELTAQSDQMKADAADVQSTVKDANATLLAANAPSSAYSAVDAVVEQFTQGNITADEAQIQIGQAISGYGTSTKDQLANELTASTIAKNYADIANEQLNPDTLASVKQGLNSANGVSYYTSTTLDGVSATQKNALTQALIQSGAIELSPKDADTMDSIQTAQQDTQALASQLDTLLPKTAAGQPAQALNTQWNKFLQTNPNLATFSQQWMTDIMPLLGALKGGGSSGGGGARLFTTLSAMLPQPTDTVAAAQSKIGAITNALITGQNSILGIKPVNIGGQEYQVGQTIYNSKGQAGTVNADGTITPQQ